MSDVAMLLLLAQFIIKNVIREKKKTREVWSANILWFTHLNKRTQQTAKTLAIK